MISESDNYIDVSNVYYSSEENIDKHKLDNSIKKRPKVVVKEISTVSDYLRSIIMVLSNVYFISRSDIPIMEYENLFSYANGENIDDILRDKGIYFRGESRNFKYQMPGLFRNAKYILNEKDILEANKTYSPDELRKSKSIFDILTLIQHYGGSTRILDITSNALIALYFAVSNNLDQDGYVYLISKNEHKVKFPDDKSVIVKAAISELEYMQKRALSENLSKKRQSDEDLKCCITNGSEKTFVEAVENLYLVVEKNLNASNIYIPVKDLFEFDIVQPYRLDKRIIQQSGAFIIFGLEDINKAQKQFNDYSDSKSRELNKLKEKLESRQRNLESRRKNDESEGVENSDLDDQLRKLGISIAKLDREIPRRQAEIFDKCLEGVVQSDSSRIIKDLSLPYSQEAWIKPYLREGDARIKIKAEHKRAILGELSMLGINESTIYPDIQHKTRIINSRFGS